jgi:hypothetical protein
VDWELKREMSIQLPALLALNRGTTNEFCPDRSEDVNKRPRATRACMAWLRVEVDAPDNDGRTEALGG